jgi:hypothetical protein
MFQALRGPWLAWGRLLLHTIEYAECPPLLAIHLMLNLVGGEGHGVNRSTVTASSGSHAIRPNG